MTFRHEERTQTHFDSKCGRLVSMGALSLEQSKPRIYRDSTRLVRADLVQNRDHHSSERPSQRLNGSLSTQVVSGGALAFRRRSTEGSSLSLRRVPQQWPTSRRPSSRGVVCRSGGFKPFPPFLPFAPAGAYLEAGAPAFRKWSTGMEGCGSAPSISAPFPSRGPPRGAQAFRGCFA